jgi:hypothetical protein
MKTAGALLALLLLAFQFSAYAQFPVVSEKSDTTQLTEPGKRVQVRAYTRKDGTVVHAHTRAAPGTGTSRRSTTVRRAVQKQHPCPATG